MVKAVVGDESRLKSVEDRLRQAGIGLVIGKLSKRLDKGFVYDLIPTPLNDAGEPAASLVETGRDDSQKKGSKGKPPTLFIDKDWMAEHARQVSRMLVGGVMVIGVYISVNESSFKNSTTLLCHTIKAVADAVPSVDFEIDERLLIHMSYSPRRWTCRNCSVASRITSSILQPCDFKMGKVLTYLKEFRCTYNFNIKLPVYTGSEQHGKSFSDFLRHGLSAHAKALQSAKCLIDGRLVLEEDQFQPDGLHKVEFLLPFMQDQSLEAYSQEEVGGVMVFTGSVGSFTYLNPKESVSQALHDIKEDIIISFYSRLDILCDEAEGEASGHFPTSNQVLQLMLQLQTQHSSLSFPRRVFVPWLAGLYICDYLLPSETIKVVKDHCAELMSMEAPNAGSEILDLESDSSLTTSTTKSFWDMVTISSSTPKPKLEDSVVPRKLNTTQKATYSTDMKTVGVFLFLLVAVLVGLILFGLQ